MMKFVLKSFIFITPFLLLIALEVFIDPFNYFSNEKNEKMFKLKENISGYQNPYLYKLIQYDRDPSPIIILGDSRMILLTPALFAKYDQEKVSNLAIGGANIQDAIEIFRYISGKNKIKKIYWGVSLETYNGTQLRNRATGSIDIRNSLPLYLMNRYTFSSAMLIIKSLIFNQEMDLDKPPFSKDEFWQLELELISRHYKNYSYPGNYYKDFEKISAYCQKNSIDLIFVICPTYTDMQKKIQEYNLEEADAKFKFDMKSFGDVYDFNIPNILTSDPENFKDPSHCKDFFAAIVVEEIALNKPGYSLYSERLK